MACPGIFSQWSYYQLISASLVATLVYKERLVQMGQPKCGLPALVP